MIPKLVSGISWVCRLIGGFLIGLRFVFWAVVVFPVMFTVAIIGVTPANLKNDGLSTLKLNNLELY